MFKLSTYPNTLPLYSASLMGRDNASIILGAETGTWPRGDPHETESTGKRGDDSTASG